MSIHDYRRISGIEAHRIPTEGRRERRPSGDKWLTVSERLAKREATEHNDHCILSLRQSNRRPPSRPFRGCRKY